jgi:hypothetical protein
VHVTCAQRLLASLAQHPSWPNYNDLLASINSLSQLASPCCYTNSDMVILRSFYNRHCPFCSGVPESVEHLFVAWSRLLELWASLMPASSPLGYTTAVAESFGGAPPAVGHTVALAVLWAIWKSRNKLVFDAVQLSRQSIAASISDHATLWTCCSS